MRYSSLAIEKPFSSCYFLLIGDHSAVPLHFNADIILSCETGFTCDSTEKLPDSSLAFFLSKKEFMYICFVLIISIEKQNKSPKLTISSVDKLLNKLRETG